MYVQAGGDELLFSDSVGVVKKAREAGVTVEFDVWESMFHGWQFLSPFIPEAREALGALTDWHHRIIAGGS
jgi:acetyl esterase/lipase